MARAARVIHAVVYLQCPYCDHSGFENDNTYGATFTSDDTLQGHRLNGTGTVKCPDCGAAVRVPKVSFA